MIFQFFIIKFLIKNLDKKSKQIFLPLLQPYNIPLFPALVVKLLHRLIS